MILRRNKGMVLVFALWVLGILTILAVSVAAGIRQKIFLVQRLDERSRMSYLLQAAVKKAAGYIHQEMEIGDFAFSPTLKMNLFNNTAEMSNIMLRHDSAGVGYLTVPDDATQQPALRWGMVDEESKINLNKTDALTLATLLENVLSLNEENAQKFAQALLDWRQYGEGDISGFYSDDYYNNLEYPYPKKSADYENLDELLLIKGMTTEMYNKLLNYVTIYGDGTVNINTASKPVLVALGIPETVVDIILSVRRGKDGIDGTADDNVFLKTFEITSDINAVTALTLEQARSIDAVNMRGLLSTNSFYYTIMATGKLSNRSNTNFVRAVYSARDDKIVYWSER